MLKDNKAWQWFLHIWKDPVWSKVISAAIIFVIASAWAKYSDYTIEDIFNYSISFLVFRVPIYYFLCLFGLYFVIKILLKLRRTRKSEIWDEQIGNFKFGELYSILQGQNLPVSTNGMKISGKQPPNDDLLALFYMYSIYLNSGVTIDNKIDDGGYLYGILCPKLLSYGLVEKIEVHNSEVGIVGMKYITSELGHKFYSLLEKVVYMEKKNKPKAAN